MGEHKEDLLEQEQAKEEVKEESKKERKLKPKEQIEKLAAENYQLREKYLSVQAELENYKKRINKERVEDRKYAAMDLIADLLIPLEQLKKASAMETEEAVLKNFLIGFKMISDQIYEQLENKGLKHIEALDKEFDPKYHYAVEKDNNKDVAEGIITAVIQEGYMFKEKLLRPSMVKVNEWSEEENE